MYIVIATVAGQEIAVVTSNDRQIGIDRIKANVGNIANFSIVVEKV